MIEFDEIIVELSYNCNLSCSMCGFGKDVNPYNKSKFLTIEKYKKILYEVGDKTKTIRLNGRGESTIHPDFIKILNLTKVQYPNVNINLFSNLSFNNKAILDALMHNCVQIFVSMDSSKSEELSAIRKGARFQYIEKNIDGLSDLSKRPFIVFTIQEANIHRILDIAKFAYEKRCHILYNTVRRDEGIDTFIKIVNDEQQNIIEQFEQVQKLYSHSNLHCLCPDQLAGIKLNFSTSIQTHGTMQSCPALTKELCIFYDGTTTPCNMFNPYVYGNILIESIDELWKSQRRLDFLKTHKNHYYCKNCANLGM